MKIERIVNGRPVSKTVSEADGKKLIAKGWKEVGNVEAVKTVETSTDEAPKETTAKRGRPPKGD